jgi:hypothetical protein
MLVSNARRGGMKVRDCSCWYWCWVGGFFAGVLGFLLIGFVQARDFSFRWPLMWPVTWEKKAYPMEVRLNYGLSTTMPCSRPTQVKRTVARYSVGDRVEVNSEQNVGRFFATIFDVKWYAFPGFWGYKLKDTNPPYRELEIFYYERELVRSIK